MIALDINILVRFYVEDPGDPEAQKRRPIARRSLDGQGRVGPEQVQQVPVLEQAGP